MWHFAPSRQRAAHSRETIAVTHTDFDLAAPRAHSIYRLRNQYTIAFTLNPICYMFKPAKSSKLKVKAAYQICQSILLFLVTVIDWRSYHKIAGNFPIWHLHAHFNWNSFYHNYNLCFCTVREAVITFKNEQAIITLSVTRLGRTTRRWASAAGVLHLVA